MRDALSTRRLSLRAFVPADAEELHVLFADPLTHTIGSGPFHALSQTVEWIDRRIRTFRLYGLCWYAVRAGDALIGDCGVLNGRTGPVEPEIGYLIGASHRGQGYALEAAVAVLAECRSVGIARVWATIRPENLASRRIAARLGMRLERVDRDERGSLVFYVIDL